MYVFRKGWEVPPTPIQDVGISDGVRGVATKLLQSVCLSDDVGGSTTNNYQRGMSF